MHHSENPTRKAFPLTCYCDDSATHENSQNAVIGGFLMGRDAFFSFDYYWRSTLDRYRIRSPFKIGNLSETGLYPELKLALVRDLVQVVNHHKFYSMSVSVPQAEFKALMSIEIYRRLFSPYACAFVFAVMMNHMAMEDSYKTRAENDAIVSYLIDSGSWYEDQLRAGHRLIADWQERYTDRVHTGALAIDSDTNVSALQGSDMIAWTVNRKATLGLHGEFAGFDDLFSEVPFIVDGKPTGRSKPHMRLDIPPGGIQLLADDINRWLDAGIWPDSIAALIAGPPIRLE